MYLRELPEPLIPKQFYEPVIKLVNRDMHQDPKSALQRLSVLLSNVPRENYNLMTYLSQFLNRVAQFSKENKMSGMNLATVFLNAYLRPEDEDPALLMGTSAGRTQVTFVLITECESIFSMEYTADGSFVKVGSLLDIDDSSSTVIKSETPRPRPTVSESVSVKDDERSGSPSQYSDKYADKHMNSCGVEEVDNTSEAPNLPPKPPPRPSRSSSLPRGVSSIMELVDIQTDFPVAQSGSDSNLHHNTNERDSQQTPDGPRKLSPRRPAPSLLSNSLHRRLEKNIIDIFIKTHCISA